MANNDFASLMQGSGAALRAGRKLENGQVVETVVLAIGDDAVFVDVGAAADGRIDRGDFVDASGKLEVKVGQRVRATVVDARHQDGPVLSMATGRGRFDAAALERALASGTPVEGEVTGEVKGGVEVKIGGTRAFCPASQTDLPPGTNLASLVGQTDRFKVIEVRDGGRSVIVSRKALAADERQVRTQEALERLAPGMDVEGVVVSIQKYGAFVDIGGLQGLLHVSEVATRRVHTVDDVLKEGDKITVRVLTVDRSERGTRVSLSLAALEAERGDARAEPHGDQRGASRKSSSFGSLGDILRQKLGLPEPPAPPEQPPPVARTDAATPRAEAPARASRTPDSAPRERKAPPDGVVRRARSKPPA